MNVFDVLREKLKQKKKILIDLSNEHRNNDKRLSTGYANKALAMGDAIEIVNQVEQEYNNGWIPCSERLPNENEVWIGHDITDAEPREFIVMVKGAQEPATGYYTSDGWVKDIFDKEISGYADEIVAWRFFPEPYKQDGNPRKQTNADRIRAMSDEELTKIIMCPYDTAGASIDIMPCVMELGTQELVSSEFCNQCVMKWLQREVEE